MKFQLVFVLVLCVLGLVMGRSRYMDDFTNDDTVPMKQGKRGTIATNLHIY
jgi:hypothetical protein